jgi:hypothetical protein
MDRTACARCATRAGLMGVETRAGGNGSTVGTIGNGSTVGTIAGVAASRSRTGAVQLRARAAEHVAPPPPPTLREPPRAVAVVTAPADAAPARLDHVLRAVAHAVVLVSVVGFVVAYCVVMPIRRQIAGRRESATVMLVADPLLAVRSPDVTGVFIATRPLPHGARVRKGELLGHIQAPKLDDELAAASVESSNIQVRLLRLEQRGAVHEPTPQEALEARDLSTRLEIVRQSLARLEKLRSQLAVYAPADGLVQQGLSATLEILPHQAIVSLFPDGGSLVMEVSAPLDVLRELQRDGQFAAAFATPDGTVKIHAKPVGASVRQFLRTLEDGREETWGTVQCVPQTLPADVRSPGLIGKLES